MAKKNPELPGLARPTIKSIDTKCVAHLEAIEAKETAAEAAKVAKAAMMAMLQKHREKLEKDSDENHVYVYRDGDERKVFVLTHDDGLRVRNEKKTDEPEGDIG